MIVAVRHRFLLLPSALFCIPFGALAQTGPPARETQLPPTFVPSGERMYKQFCAACHGANAKGHGPAASSLKVAPPDLTTLAKRYKGKFPYNYVSSVLHFGPGVSAHGSSAMPTWGPIFRRLGQDSEGPLRVKSEIAVRDRIQNLCDYLASLQVR
jgi:mono/diheme cytochrome c family protein